MPVPGKFRDRSFRLELDSKGLRFLNGARPEFRAPFIFDHFVYGAGAINSHVPQNWVTTETGAATPYAPSATTESGVLIATTGATTNNGEELAGKMVGWSAVNMGVNTPLVFETRAKFVGATTAADGDYYIGLADAVTYTNSLPYVVSAASAFTTSAPVEFAGFGYSSIPSSGAWFNSAGNNFIGIVTEKASVAPAPAAATTSTVAKDSAFHIYRVEIDATGNASFQIDDKFIASVALAVTAATKLTPYIVATAKNSHAQTATIDWMFVGGEIL